ncbi:uncharacterized protein METZ01_LOCUS118318, partial [marine metagenome]
MTGGSAARGAAGPEAGSKLIPMVVLGGWL